MLETSSPSLIKIQEQGIDIGRQIARLLQQARLARGENLVDIAHQLHIRPAYLEALEQGQFNLAVGRPYVLGFLRSYATHLGLASDELTGALKEWLEQVPASAEPKDREPPPLSYRSTIAIVTGGLLLVAAIYATGHSFLDVGSGTGTTARPAEVTPAADNMLQPGATGQTHRDDAAAVPAPAGAPDTAPFAPTQTSPPGGTEPAPADDIGPASSTTSSPVMAAPAAQGPVQPPQALSTNDSAAFPGGEAGMADLLPEPALRDAATPPAVPNELLPAAEGVKTLQPPVAMKDDPPSDPPTVEPTGTTAANLPPMSTTSDPALQPLEGARAASADLENSRSASLTRPTPAPAADSFSIHLASVRDPALAADEWQRLARRYPSLASLEPRPPAMIEIPGRGKFYRVVGGTFATRSEAVAACDRLRAQHQYCRVVAP